MRWPSFSQWKVFWTVTSPATGAASATQPRSLSDGRAIPADVAIPIIANVSVEPANDGLFPDLLAQTWRMK